MDDRHVRLVERVFGHFRRAIQLPFSPNPDQVEASFRNGVLTITVPKNAEQRSKQRQIEVRRDSGPSGAVRLCSRLESQAQAPTRRSARRPGSGTARGSTARDGRHGGLNGARRHMRGPATSSAGPCIRNHGNREEV